MRKLLGWALVGYAIGSVPIAYLAGRLLAGEDIGETGTGSIGASNLWHTRGRWAVPPIGVLQILQGALPSFLASQTSASAASRVIAGLAGIAGQDWNPYLRFRGGRGMTHSLGFLLAVSPESLAGVTALGLAGVAMKQIPLAMLAGLVVSPAVAWRAGRPPAVVRGCAGAALLACIKRLEANGRPLPAEQDRGRTFLYRLLFDRDVLDRDTWLAAERSGV